MCGLWFMLLFLVALVDLFKGTIFVQFQKEHLSASKALNICEYIELFPEYFIKKHWRIFVVVAVVVFLSSFLQLFIHDDGKIG